MNETRSLDQEAAEDIFFGQVVIVWARWFIIAGGAVITLLQAENTAELTSSTIFVVALMGINFFVHGRYIMERPANRILLIALSVLDLAIVTGIIVALQGQNGLASPYFVFLYPIVVAFAFVFTPRMSTFFTAVALAAYTYASFAGDPELLNNSVDLEILVVRLITLASMGGLATFFWRIQRNRRREIQGVPVASEGS
jgi:hypothetical protein